MGRWVNRYYGGPFGTRYTWEWEGDYSNYPSGQNPPIKGDHGYIPPIQGTIGGYTPSNHGYTSYGPSSQSYEGYTPPSQGNRRDPSRLSSPLVKFLLTLFGCLVLFGIIFGILLGLSRLVQNNVSKMTLSAGSTWDGDEFRYDNEAYNSGHTEMILTIDSIKKESLYGKVHWPHVGDTVTKAEGTIVANVNAKDIHWKYVLQCWTKGIYLQFTETRFIQDGGKGVILNAKYYAVVCFGMLSGVWFYPDQPNGYPGGEFSLLWKSP